MRIPIRPILSVVCLLLLAIWAQGQAAASTAPSVTGSQRANFVEGYGKLPLAFEANQGQSDSHVKFLSRGVGYGLFLTCSEAVLTLQPSAVSDQHSGKQKPAVLRMKLRNANPKTIVTGQEELPGMSNYFIGNDPKKWHTNVRQFAKVRYESVYPGIDLVYYGNQRELEYDFVLQPGARPEQIRLGIEGAQRLQFDQGDLVLTSAGGEVRLRSPLVYQEANGIRHGVRAQYVMSSKSEVGFRVAGYDRKRALVIDPVLAYSTYLGGNNDDTAYALATDAAGNAYMAGATHSIDFPTTHPIQATRHGAFDVFVTKIKADGAALVYSTYLGGAIASQGWSPENFGLGIGVDAAGNAYVTGYTYCSDFPVLNAFQPTLHGNEDAFVSKLSARGASLVYSSYLGGGSSDEGWAVAADAAGNAYVTGLTYSADFPVFNALQPTLAGTRDAFVTKINAEGTAFVYSTFLGGNASVYGPGTWGQGIAADRVGNAYVTGSTETSGFPTYNAIQPQLNGARNGFVSKINDTGSAFVYSTYLGGSYDDRGYAIAADAAGNAYITGMAVSSDFPVAKALQPAYQGGADAFVTKVNASGSEFVYSTYLGGSGQDSGLAIATDPSGNAYVTGTTFSSDFPTLNALQAYPAGNGDAFVSLINPDGSAFVYSTFLGGTAYDVALGIAADSLGSAYVAGSTSSHSFPKTLLAFQPSLRQKKDAFVAKIALQTFTKISTTKLGLGGQSVGATSKPKKVILTNSGPGELTINRIYMAGENSGDFSQTNDCGASLPAGGSCTVSVTFTPTAAGARKATLGIRDSDPANPQAVALSGTGSVVSLSAKRLAFADGPVGTSSAPQIVTLQNVGATQLRFTGITITGTNARDFSQTSTCGTSIAGGASCTISVTFAPTAQGMRKATMSISDDGGGSPQKITLTGTGI